DWVTVILDACLRLPPRPQADPRLRRNARGRDGRIREKLAATMRPRKSFPLGVVVKNSISFLSPPREAMSEWQVHWEVTQSHVQRSQHTKEAALKDACSQLLQGHAVNRIVGPNETITAERVRDWCAKHRASPTTQSPNSDI